MGKSMFLRRHYPDQIVYRIISALMSTPMQFNTAMERDNRAPAMHKFFAECVMLRYLDRARLLLQRTPPPWLSSYRWAVFEVRRIKTALSDK